MASKTPHLNTAASYSTYTTAYDDWRTEVGTTGEGSPASTTLQLAMIAALNVCQDEIGYSGPRVTVEDVMGLQ